MKGANGGHITKFVWNSLSLESRSKWKEVYTGNVAYKGTRTTMKPWSSSMDLSWREDVSNEMKGGREFSHAPCRNLMKMNTLSIDRFCLGKHNSHICNGKDNLSATPTTYPATCLAFFISSWRVHLDLQTLTCLFFSLAFSFVFLSTSTLISSKVPD